MLDFCAQAELLSEKSLRIRNSCTQGLEPDEEEDPDAYLMECWPDDPADIGLESVLKTVGPLFEQRLYPAGTKLARQGDPAHCIYFIEEGCVEVMHTMIKDGAVDSDEEEEEEVQLLEPLLAEEPHSLMCLQACALLCPLTIDPKIGDEGDKQHHNFLVTTVPSLIKFPCAGP